ncbi:MAG: site-2 protease family protein [Acidobacteriota bacterium]|nr:MAG: site-2 protease family protein [Acidobacteriota bacterium]
MSLALGFLIYLVLLFSLSVHECAHAWTAYRLGDPTARYLGRVTLNPIPHIDVVGTVIFPLFMIFGGVPLFGWAKPVPVNPYNLHNPRRDHMWVAAAGPLSNFALCLVGILLYRIFFVETSLGGGSRLLHDFLLYGAILNAVLGTFNLIPIPPLDGGGVIERFLSPAMAQKFEMIKPFGMLILFAFLLLGLLHLIIMPIQALVLFLMTVPL